MLLSIGHGSPPDSHHPFSGAASTPLFPKAPMTTPYIGRPHDFDFLAGGLWHVANRRLRQRQAGSVDWRTFDATSRAATHLGGQVSTDEIIFADQSFRGFTVRTLDVAAQRWAIYWIDSRVGRMTPPVIGGWSGDRGEFFGEDEDEGRPVRVRFLWERLGGDQARWSQDFASIGQDGAADGPWETNWVMEMRRVKD
jgi:hypothetical protein